MTPTIDPARAWSIARRAHRVVALAAMLLLFAAIAASLLGALQVALSAHDYSWAWTPDDARRPHWLMLAIKRTVAPATVVGFLQPVFTFAEVVLCFGAGVAACLNGHPLEGLGLIAASAVLIVVTGVQVWLADLVAAVVARLWKTSPASQQQRTAERPLPQIQADIDLYRAERARRNFAQVAGMAELKARLLEAGRAALVRKSDAPNGILLHGEPGNGKTLFAEALAGELGVRFLSVSIADVVSRWVGQTPEQLSAVFRAAERQAPCLLFIDEIDSLIADRTQAQGTHDTLRTTNVFLTEVVRLRGKGVVIVAATNFLDRLDAAAVREGRFDFKIEVTAPDEAARVALLRAGLSQHAPRVRVAEDVVTALAKRWVGFSVSRLLAVAQEAGKFAREQERAELSFQDIMACLRRVQGRAYRVPESTKSLAQLMLQASQRQALESIAHRMRRAFETEVHGGTLPQGVLFWGPPGTGKTEAARALAKETGWSFIPTSGNELLGDPAALDRHYAQAKQARPAIIFIDEADDVLMDREFSAARSTTNRLLTLIDGADGRVPDLLFIAATNHPHVMDAAALRGGRFTEKVAFAVPGAAELAIFMAQWLADKGWALQMQPQAAAQWLQGRAIADVQAVLQVAVNEAIARAQRAGTPVPRVIGDAELHSAMQRVLTSSSGEAPAD